jgi:hypothetical protein
MLSIRFGMLKYKMLKKGKNLIICYISRVDSRWEESIFLNWWIELQSLISRGIVFQIRGPCITSECNLGRIPLGRMNSWQLEDDLVEWECVVLTDWNILLIEQGNSELLKMALWIVMATRSLYNWLRGRTLRDL